MSKVRCSTRCASEPVLRLLLRLLCSVAVSYDRKSALATSGMEMEMDSHGGLEVTIRQTESKKKLPNNFVKQTPECS